MQDFTNFDNDLECRSNEENTAGSAVENEEQSSDEENEIVKPSNLDVEKALETLKNFSLTTNVADSFSEHLKQLKSDYFKMKRLHRQTIIHEFFRETQ